MAWILRKLVVTMLVPFLWRRWRDRDRTGARRSSGPQASGSPSHR
jgi:hypothetical protein